MLSQGFFNYYYFIYLFLTVLGLHCCLQAFSGCSEHGAQVSHCSGFSYFGAQALGRAGPIVGAHGHRCRTACGIFPEQGSNPCPLRWQGDSHLPCHQGSPFLPEILIYVSSLLEPIESLVDLQIMSLLLC